MKTKIVVVVQMLIAISCVMSCSKKPIVQEYPPFITQAIPEQHIFLKGWGNFPPEGVLSRKLLNENYPGIGADFRYWTLLNLKKEYVPTEEELQKNLVLMKGASLEHKTVDTPLSPGTAEYGRSDVAYFGDIAYRAGNINASLRIVQVACEGLICFFVQYPDMNAPSNASDALKLMKQTVDHFCNASDDINRILTPAVYEAGVYYSRPWMGRYNEVQRQHLCIDAYVVGNVVCLMFPKQFFGGDDDSPDQAAKAMEYGKWFDYFKVPSMGPTLDK